MAGKRKKRNERPYRPAEQQEAQLFPTAPVFSASILPLTPPVSPLVDTTRALSPDGAEPEQFHAP